MNKSRTVYDKLNWLAENEVGANCTFAARGLGLDMRRATGAAFRALKLSVSLSLIAFCVGSIHSQSFAAINFTVSFTDPSNTYAAYDAEITSCLQAAGALWSARLTDSGTLSVNVSFSDIPTANGGSATSGAAGTDGARTVYEQGAAYKIRTGDDPNGSSPDINVSIGTAYLTNTMWFDPTPSNRTDEIIPPNRIDAVSVFTHELGHAFAFNGWRDQTTEALPDTYESTFDKQTTVMGGYVYFIGPGAEAIYGGPVPLTLNNSSHFGNSSGPGTDLIGDLMNGVVYNYDTRYTISPLDIAVFRDIGIGVNAASLPGDFDQNGVVNAADYVLWRNGLGTTYTANDYSVWRAHFGQIGGNGTQILATTAVPEPAILTLLLTSCGFLAGWRKISRHC